jgi:hypothetical protein
MIKTVDMNLKYVFGLLVLSLDNPEHRRRLKWVNRMPVDWAEDDPDNYHKVLAMWSRALKKAAGLGLVEQGLGGYWIATKKGREYCRICKQAGFKPMIER